MDSGLIKAIGLKALLVGVGALLLFWTFNAIKLVISARGINPLVKKFFDQIAAGRIDKRLLILFLRIYFQQDQLYQFHFFQRFD